LDVLKLQSTYAARIMKRAWNTKPIHVAWSRLTRELKQ